MKLNHLISGILLAAVMLMCGASYAGTFTNDGILAAAPTDTVMVYKVDPPLVPAVKPNSDGFIAMATDNSNDNKSNPEYCMAACHNDKRTLVGLNYLQSKVTDNLELGTVLACSWIPAPIEKPMKIPISV